MRAVLTVPFFFIFLYLSTVTGLVFGLLLVSLISVAGSYFVRSFFNRKISASSLGNKNAVVVTGCSTGIGRDVAIHLARNGFRVFAGIRNPQDGDELKRNSDRITPVVLDVTNKSQVDQAVNFVRDRLSNEGLQLYALVNNAGTVDTSVMELTPVQNLRHQFEVNTIGPVLVTQAFLPLLRQSQLTKTNSHNSRVIFVSSIAGLVTVRGLGPYCASKYALESINDSFRMELQPWNIDVIDILPGRTKTRMQDQANQMREFGLNPNMEQLYCGQEVANQYRDQMINSINIESSLKKSEIPVATDTIKDALLDSVPHTRYFSGGDSRLLSVITLLIPDRVLDYISASPMMMKFLGMLNYTAHRN